MKQPIKYRNRRRSDGMWEIVWTDPDTGKVKRESCKTRSELEADKKLAEKILSGDVVPPEVVTIGYTLDRYFQHIARRKSDNTVIPMRSKIARLKEALGEILWEYFSQADVERYTDHARTQVRWGREDERGLSDGTIASDLRVLRSSLRHAHLHRVVPTETRIEIKGLHSEKRDTWLDREQFRKVIECCASDEREHIYAFLLLALATGARKEAVFELRWDQVYIPSAEVDYSTTPRLRVVGDDVKNKQREVVVKNPTFRKGGEVVRGAYIDFGEGHGNKRRPKIPIGQNEPLMWYLSFGGDRDQPYVVSHNGKPIRTGIKKGLEAVGKEARLPFKLTHHVLKRTSITWMVREGIPFETISQLTNTTVETLKKHYSQHSPDLEEALGDTFAF